ncbi:MAG: hypothetical protein KDA96_26775, partial [Planctomycetaceae bacterium]|nr:hypothetical protein [Planctomycetaceae bacterium]
MSTAPKPLHDANIVGTSPLVSPAELLREVPATDEIARHVVESRALTENILRGADRRVIAIVGP